jgi:hypothetical protein
MEKGERKPAGFQYSPEVRQNLLEAFGLYEGKTWNADPQKVVQLTRAQRFLKAVENRAAMDMLTPKESVDVIITARIQEEKSDVTRAIDDLADKAETAGLIINDETSQREIGNISGKIFLTDAPQLAVNMFKDNNIYAVELRQDRPKK